MHRAYWLIALIPIAACASRGVPIAAIARTCDAAIHADTSKFPAEAATIHDEVALWRERVPLIMKDGSPQRQAVTAEFMLLMKEGAPANAATELLALRTGFGPIEEATKQKGESLFDRYLDCIESAINGNPNAGGRDADIAGNTILMLEQARFAVRSSLVPNTLARAAVYSEIASSQRLAARRDEADDDRMAMGLMMAGQGFQQMGAASRVNQPVFTDCTSTGTNTNCITH